MIERLKECPCNGNPRVYVTIHKGIGGWNSSVRVWDDSASFAFYDVVQTGITNTSLGTGSREDAIAEAENWAECDGTPLWIPPLPAGQKCN